MTTKRHQTLRIAVIVLLALLGLQYEFGMAVNLTTQPSLPAFGFSLNAISNALNQIGAVAMIHASLGSGLVIFSIDKPGLIPALRPAERAGLWQPGFPDHPAGRHHRAALHDVRFSKQRGFAWNGHQLPAVVHLLFSGAVLPETRPTKIEPIRKARMDIQVNADES